MALIEPTEIVDFEDIEMLPTSAQQALAEQRLAEMINDPSTCESVESLIAYAKSLMR